VNVFHIIRESSVQAYRELVNNKLRTFLSLLGIMIGIFCIISVQSAVNSLEKNIRSSFDKLGNDVIYLDRRPWIAGSPENWWKYANNPMPSYNDFETIQQKSEMLDIAAISAFLGDKTATYKKNVVDGNFVISVSPDYSNIFNLQYDNGRFFSYNDMRRGSNSIVLGYDVAQELFGNLDPIGKEISLGGRKFYVIGVLEKTGKSLINPLDFDEVVMIPFSQTQYFANLNGDRIFIQVMAKALPGVPIDGFKEELTSIIRAERRLKPKEGDNFALNELSLISNAFDSVFGALRIAGLIIGGFAILVGLFSVANIMFVSVKERTHLIGIKKAIGATSRVIMMEFLIESVVLCIIGGLLGLVLVSVVLMVVSNFSSFAMSMSVADIFTGVMLSIIVGILAGVIPAGLAARLMPVDAIRQG
jgi:putative ABC transport system permease protein